MPIDDTLLRLKAKTYGKGNLMKVAQEIGVSDDTLRRILSSDPPTWVSVVRKMQEIAGIEAGQQKEP
jgi:DNA-binding phage protein